eukprot:4422626-Prymnesium_polylepis.1
MFSTVSQLMLNGASQGPHSRDASNDQGGEGDGPIVHDPDRGKRTAGASSGTSPLDAPRARAHSRDSDTSTTASIDSVQSCPTSNAPSDALCSTSAFGTSGSRSNDSRVNSEGLSPSASPSGYSIAASSTTSSTHDAALSVGGRGLEHAARHAQVEVEGRATRQVVRRRERVDSAAVGVDRGTAREARLNLWRQPIVREAEVRKARIARAIWRLDYVVHHMAEYLAAKGAIVVPLGPHRVEAVLRIVGQPEYVATRRLGVDA